MLGLASFIVTEPGLEVYTKLNQQLYFLPSRRIRSTGKESQLNTPLYNRIPRAFSGKGTCREHPKKEAEDSWAGEK